MSPQQCTALIRGYAQTILPKIPERLSVAVAITSPPYYGLRGNGVATVWPGDKPCADHDWTTIIKKGITGGKASPKVQVHGKENYSEVPNQVQKLCAWCGAWYGELGQEPDPLMFVRHLVEIFREVRRILRKDGSAWIVVGDSYAGSGRGPQGKKSGVGTSYWSPVEGREHPTGATTWPELGIKRKDLIGIPWELAFALRRDGWYLREVNIWDKPNGFPYPARDRCVVAHEYLIHVSKSAVYHFDPDAIREPTVDGTALRLKRSVWRVKTRGNSGEHTSSYPEALIEPMILSCSKPGDLVLDPFSGSATTGAVALKLGRRYVGIEPNAAYYEEAAQRLERIIMEQTNVA